MIPEGEGKERRSRSTSHATGKTLGSPLWVKMYHYHYFQLNRDEFMEHYHKRSNTNPQTRQ